MALELNILNYSDMHPFSGAPISKKTRDQEVQEIILNSLFNLKRPHFTDQESKEYLESLGHELKAVGLLPEDGKHRDVREIFKKVILNTGLKTEVLLDFSRKVKDPELKAFLIRRVQLQDPSVKTKHQALGDSIVTKIKEMNVISPNHMARSHAFKPEKMTDESYSGMSTYICDLVNKYNAVQYEMLTAPKKSPYGYGAFGKIHSLAGMVDQHRLGQCGEIASFIFFLPELEGSLSAIVTSPLGKHSWNVYDIDPNCTPSIPETWGATAWCVCGWNGYSFSPMDWQKFELATEMRFPTLPDGKENLSKIVTLPLNRRGHGLEFTMTTLPLPETFLSQGSFAQTLFMSIGEQLAQYHTSSNTKEKVAIASHMLYELTTMEKEKSGEFIWCAKVKPPFLMLRDQLRYLLRNEKDSSVV